MRQRFIQDPLTYELIPADEYHRRCDVNAPMVMPDIQPYKSMITGEMIQSRSAHRDHLRQHGCIEIGNETKHMKSKPMTPPPGLKERLIQVVNSRR